MFESIVGILWTDTLRGNSLNNLLIGSAHSDMIFGRGGRDLLIGGTGDDSISAGAGEDILISGNFIYNEGNRTLNRAAVDAILAEWTRTDADYATRIAHLRTSGGLNGATLLNGFTNDGVVDWLMGEEDLDWFWRSPGDSIGDHGTGAAPRR